MDLFKLLSRGATINRKQKQDLSAFNGRNASQEKTDADIDRRLNFFAAPSKSRKPANNTNDEKPTHIVRIKTPEDAAEFRRAHKTKVSGDAPLPIASFEDLVSRYEMSSKLRRNLEKTGFDSPTAIQSEAIPIMMEEHDLMAVAPTGSGKTLAFVVPLIQALVSSTETSSRGPRALIVSPTRELATQIYQVAVELSRGYDTSVALLNKKQLAKLRNNNAGKKSSMDLMVATPLRLIEGHKEGLFTLDNVQWLVLDEADKLLGHGFVEQSDQIMSLCTNSHLVRAVFSATMPANIEELARSVMTTQPCRVIVGHKEGAADTVNQELVYCGSEVGKLTAIRQLLMGVGTGNAHFVPPILVFVQSIQRAKALFHELIYDKINVDVIHSELSQNQRDRVINQFKQGDIWVLICTDVLARGIDFQGINLVVNYDVPLSGQAYVHRIGRTGRAGRHGSAITYYTNQDLETLRPIVNVMRQSGIEVSDWLVTATNSRKHKRDQPVKRQEISTVPRVVKQKHRHKRDMIEASKRKKAASE